MAEHDDTPWSPEDDHQGGAFAGGLVRRSWAYTRPYRRDAALVVFLTFVTMALGVAGPVLFGRGLDRGVSGGDTRALLVFATLFLACELALFLGRSAQDYLGRSVSQHAMFDLRCQAFAHLERLPLAWFDRTPVGVTVHRVANDVAALEEFFTSGLLLAADLAQVLAVAAVLFWVQPGLAGWVLLASLPLVLAVTVFRPLFRTSYRELRSRLARINGFIQEAADGARVVKLFRRERANDLRFRELNEAHLAAGERSLKLHAVFGPTVTLGTALGHAVVLGAGGWAVLEGRASLGDLVIFLFLLNRLTMPIRELAELYNTVLAGMAAAERVFKLLDEPAELDAEDAVRPRARERRESRGLSIEFQGVDFSYGPGDSGRGGVLRNLSFRIEPGEKVALVGLTGAGKTTIISLVARFYLPQRGRVLVDGKDTADWDLADLRRRLGFILQEPYLFPGTVRDNVRLGDESVSEEDLRRAVALVQAERFVARLPAGYDTEVGERGNRLSSGERQLLSFARVLAADPDILILDEATSHVDPETDRLIARAVDEVFRFAAGQAMPVGTPRGGVPEARRGGRTALIIAHRLETIRRVDRILVLHHGELKEDGTWEELLRLDGIFRRLHRLQFGKSA